MIIVKLWGGLCNQMFQYAFGFQMAKKHYSPLSFDIDFYKKQPKYVSSRQIEIDHCFHLSKYDIVERPRSVNPFQFCGISFLTRRMDFFRCSLPDNIYYVKEKTHTYSALIPYKENKTCYYDGYWQTEDYFKDLTYDIKKEFSFSSETIKKVGQWISQINSTNTVAIHIRRGDMIGKTPGYTDIDMTSYYHRAKEYMESIIENPVFVVFSDDISWCRNILFPLSTNVVYQDKMWDAGDDLCGISLCRHGIMSQSTFSWWGNWLGDNGERIVVAPKGEYFNNRFIPERWEVI